MNEPTALLIVDAQVNMFAKGTAVAGAERLLKILQTLIAKARKVSVLVVYIQHNGGPNDPDAPNSPGWQIEPSIAPRPGDVVLQKQFPDAFQETPLKDKLDSRGVRHVVIAGLQTEFCIQATCRRAHDLGYVTTLVADGHSTYDEAGGLTAAAHIAQCHAALQGLVQIVKADEIVFR